MALRHVEADAGRVFDSSAARESLDSVLADVSDCWW